MNGGLFLFYIFLLIVYIKDFKSKNILIFVSIELTLSSAIYALYYIYFYIRTYHVILCVINAIGQPSITMTTVLLSANYLLITMKILSSREDFVIKYKKYAVLSIILCWVIPLLLMIILFVIDIQLEQENFKIFTFTAYSIKFVNYSSYFIVGICMEFYFIKLQKEVQLFLSKIEQKVKEQEQCILQVKQFHIVNVLNLLWQVFTILITFNILGLSEYSLSIIKPIIRFVITIFFFLFLWIFCISKERMKSIERMILCCYKPKEDPIAQREESSISFCEISDENVSNSIL